MPLASRKTLRSPRAPRLSRRGLAIAAVPTAVAVGIAVLPSAGAQQAPSNPAAVGSSSLGGPGFSDAFAPSAPVQRTPVETTHPQVEGLPDGVSIDHVEYYSSRHLMVYIRSAAMPDKLQKVQILLARDWYSKPDAKFPEVWALDGLRARDDESGWTIETNIESLYADKNVNVIMPVGGESSFYSDWQQPDNGTHYMWETFLTKELVPILDKEYRSNQKRAITGISMGGTAAMNIAERNPQLFKFVGSFSGYLDTTTRGMEPAITAAQMDAGGFTTSKMWGPFGSQDWIDHDPKLGVGNLKDMTVYVSAGSGKDDFGSVESVAKGPASVAGIGLETISRMSTQTFVDYAKRAGIQPITQFRPSGVHSWEYWQFEMNQAFPEIAKALDLSKEDRGAECAPIGAIADEARAQAGQIGTCVNNEYDAAGGKAEDFQNGTAYWSPATGAHALWGRINARYAGIGGPGSWLGFPTSSEITTPDGSGRFVTFEHGSIYWTAETGAWEIPKDMLDAWGANGYETGALKYPTGAPEDVAGGMVQKFQGGLLTRNKDNQHHIVHGAIGAKYQEMGAAASKAGMPTSDEIAVNGGFFQKFEHGHIYWSPASGAHYIEFGGVFDEWGKRGWEQGEFGWPTNDFTELPVGGVSQDFQHGTIRQVNGNVQADKK